MEPIVMGSERRRGRKRKRNILQDGIVDCRVKNKVVETRSLKLVGRYVRKKFQGSRFFLGKIMLYDLGLYMIKYEDGDCEDLTSSEVKPFLVEDSDLTGKWSKRKEKLDKLLSKNLNTKVDNMQQPQNANAVDLSLLTEMISSDAGANGAPKVHDEDIGDVDSSSDSCEHCQEVDMNLDVEVPLVPPPELPPSSGHIGIPEEYVSHLLSVYSFLRSFSVRLFLYPFGLDDFVGALNCSVANTLLDCIHVALMHALKRHLERLSLEGSELASKCLRCLDWSLLDTLTWPIYLVHYLVVMGYANGPDWKGFYTHSLETDYYNLSAGKKLIVLQILCDDALDSEELRTEMDMREISEVGIDIDTSKMIPTTCEPSRTHPQNSKTSACKDLDTIKKGAEPHVIKSSLGNHSMESQVGGPFGNSINEDGSDECRLCGMDGLLICCDGCPLSYHTRCLGLNKMFMPDGPWYCPECKINATEPKILQGTALKGGENFGVDRYQQVFVASCDHLLVLKASISSKNCLRYYNRHDIPRVLHSLYSKADHVTAYSEICRGIMQHWKLLQHILPCDMMSEVGLQIANKEGSGECISQLVNLLDKSVPQMTEVENPGSCVTGAGLAASCLNCVQQPVQSGNSLDSLTKSHCHVDSTSQQPGIIMKTTMNEPDSFSCLIGHPTDPGELSQQSTSCVTETVSYATRNSNFKCIGPVNGASLEAKVSVRYQELNNRVDRKLDGNPYSVCLYMGSSLTPTSYVNYYLHGDFAACAAANLAILSSEEHQAYDSRSSDDRRKVTCDAIALQVKAFSSAVIPFFWPNTEKKLVEVPRERCSWCFSCKAAVASKRGCLLNAAASNAHRGPLKLLAGFRPVKNGDGRLSGIAAYIMFLEESLSGLIDGPFLSDTFREQWRKQIEQATSCNAMKILLLELEENIRIIALSGGWAKLVRGSTQSSTSHIAASSAVSTAKRGPGRRGRKPAPVAEVAVQGSQATSTDFSWWRGGTLSKLMFQRGILPFSIIKKVARQGARKKIPGIHYVEANETPKTSRQLVWRSAVEMSRNVAQLALQVRHLDFHVRWSDLVRPEQIPCEGKGSETVASAFRNAFICDKKTVEHEIRYCVAFGGQRHLPSRIMKNITEIEQILDGRKERYWFSETYIPLYLIKEYEQKVAENKPVYVLSKLQRRQLKASRKRTFSHFLWKKDNMTRGFCCSCHQDIRNWNPVKCTVCQGFCHERCATSSAVNMSEDVELLITCKQCCETQAATRVESSSVYPTSPLQLQGPEPDFPNPVTSSKRGELVCYKGLSASPRILVHSSEVKSTNHLAVEKKSNKLPLGLIWRKKNCNETGFDFRSKNILLRGNLDRDLMKPSCHLCNQPYNADLMYIRCETCQYWYHADAVELDESKIFFLVGFKCCKCRRTKSPVCPYLDPQKKKVLEHKIERQQAAKLEILTMASDSGITSQHRKGSSELPRTEVIHLAADDPLLVSPSEVEQCTENKSEVDYCWNNANASGPGPWKLPVRRHVKQDVSPQAGPFQISAPPEANIFKSTEKLPLSRHLKREANLSCFSATDSSLVEASHPPGANAFSSVQDSLSQVQQTASMENFDKGNTLDYNCVGFDDMEFELQTYFSLNALLSSDDSVHANGKESSEDLIANQESSSVLPKNGTLEISDDQKEPVISIEKKPIQIEPCKICSGTEPCANLCCQICGTWIHSRCSPWYESSTQEDSWRCGNCRDWI